MNRIATEDNRLRSRRSEMVLCITHSDRPVEADRCDANALQSRYTRPGRLPPTVPFRSLPHARTATPYGGAISVWDVGGSDFQDVALLAILRPRGYKPQHVIWHGDRLWVLGTELIEVYDESLRREALIEDNWLAGAHTIAPIDDDTLAVSASASDSVLMVDRRAMKVVDRFRIPDGVYGHNFDLRHDDSVVEHYVPNDLQLAHFNCAWPWRGGVLTTALIPGAIGFFDRSGSYRELLSGFVGAHGARVNPETDRIYFCDSCAGTLNVLGPDLEIEFSYRAGSRWLHDAVHLSGEVFALAVSDRNVVQVANIHSGEILCKIDGSELGCSTQFLAFGR
ncbi:MAG TPA: hypothetical protein VGA24_07150 [Steroidobacteraceae bacterium]